MIVIRYFESKIHLLNIIKFNKIPKILIVKIYIIMSIYK